jgi:hypothetical protein
MEQHAGSESTLYLVLCTWYNEVLLLDTSYLILIFVLRTKLVAHLLSPFIFLFPE